MTTPSLGPNVSPRADTIVAVSTPPGSGAISLLRLSGPRAIEIVRSLTRGRILEPRRSTVVPLIDPADGSLLDEAVATLFPAPRSYTGEDVIELGVHGNPVLVAEAMRIARREGARIAGPGEFTRRAFENGRLDLTRAEAVLEVVSAESLEALKQAQRQLGGELADRFEDLRGRTADALGLIEATLEFPDDVAESSEAALRDARERVGSLRSEVSRLLAGYERSVRVSEGVSVALLGPPNVGKSSIFNKIQNSDRAIVTAVPGTTRDALEARVRIGGRLVRLIDTAGVRDTEDVVEREGVSRTVRLAMEVDRRLLVLDASRPLDDVSRAAMRELARPGDWLLLNKVDLGLAIDRAEAEALVPEALVLEVSAKSGSGIESLEDRLAGVLEAFDAPEAAPVSSTRQRAELEHLEACLSDADTHLDERAEELAAEDLRVCMQALERLVGAAADEDVLDRIFTKFCIGK